MLMLALAALCSGLAAAGLMRAIVQPPARLATRIRPYTAASRSSLGRVPDGLAVPDPDVLLSGSTLRRLIGPMIAPLLAPLAGQARRLTTADAEGRLRDRLRHSGLLADIPDAQRVLEYRIRQGGTGLAWAGLFAAAAVLLGQPSGVVLLVGALGLASGVSRWRGRVDKAIEARCERMRAELYTVNQVLAMHVRVGGGVVQAIARITGRSAGLVAAELASVLGVHRSGRPLTDALDAAARLTPEPHAGRTYRLLASGAEFGADLAEGLLQLSRDVRADHLEDLRRRATRRRALVLIPVVGILAPVMLLFIAAPLPSIVFGA